MPGCVIDPLTWSAETPAPGLVVWQPVRGFRYAMDPFLLAAWMHIEWGGGTFVDVGSGSGILSLLLAHNGWTGVGVEVRPEWAPYVKMSRKDSGIDDTRLHFDTADVRSWTGKRADIALSNPPFFPMGEGSLSPDPIRSFARHECAGTLLELVRAMSNIADVIALVLPFRRANEAMQALQEVGRGAIRRCDFASTLVVLEGRMGAPMLSAHDSVPLLTESGDHTPEVAALYEAIGARLVTRRVDS